MPTTTRMQRRSAAIREQIVDAAEAILAAEGETGLTMEAVSSQADVAVQTVYNRVGGRSALLVAVAERAMEQNRAYLESAVKAPGQTAMERIETIAFAYAHVAESRPEQFRLITDPPGEPEALRPIEALIENQLSALSTLIAEGIEDGSIRPTFDPDTTAKTLWAMATGVCMMRIRGDRLQVSSDGLPLLVETARALLQGGMLGSPGD
ncbi:MAG: TetR/AcrR family transcriptional regulator [Solirubrobacteraceae bacterium]|nr:TetR/AcrR family transcriptional regulator [Solirubrobacteraceae bacterium]